MSGLIRQSFLDEVRRPGALPGHGDESILAGLSAWDLPRLMHQAGVPLQRQDEILAAVVRRYRQTRHPSWSAVLLEMLSPMLARAGSRCTFIPNSVSGEDLDQQLMTEALHAARFMVLPDPPHDVQRRLRRRTLSRTISWLLRAQRNEHENLEQVEEEGPAYHDLDQRFLLDLRSSGVPNDTLEVLYRSQVLKVTVRELAVEMGVSMDAVRKRLRRALRRLQREWPTRFRRFSDDLPTAA
jgi:DNA-directed RNA polymerase specialized sigma24 family protein